MVDFHTHILPANDDGSESVEESLRMLEEMKKQGIKKIVATPHFYADEEEPVVFAKRRQQSFEALSNAMRAEMELPEIVLGAEVAYFEGISDCEFLDMLKIENTNSIMIEMPTIRWNDRMFKEIEGIYLKHGLVPIIAHLDRFISMFRDRGLVKKMGMLPVVIQANADAFLGGRFSVNYFCSLVSSGVIRLIGSDCHNMTTRKPNCAEAFNVIERKLGHEAIYQIEKEENRILKNTHSTHGEFAL